MELTIKQFESIQTKVDISRLTKLIDYYKGKHEIETRTKDADLKNNKVTVNNAAYIADINTGYLVGNPVQYQVEESLEESLKPVIEEYERQAINKVDTRVARHMSIYGLAYEYVYAKPREDLGLTIKSAVLEPTKAYIQYDGTVEDNVLWGCFWHEIKDIENETKTRTEITVVDDKEIKVYTLSNNVMKFEKDKSCPHLFNKVPLIKYSNNEFEQGDFERVITLIDAINLLQSDRINDKEQLVDAILVLYAATIDDEDMKALKSNRVLMLPEAAKAEYLIKMLNEGEIDILKKSLEDDLHKISMTPNMSDENFVGNSSGVALGYKLLPFEQTVMNKASFMEVGLEYRLECYSNMLNNLGKSAVRLTADTVDTIFNRNLPQNVLELAQIVSMLSGVVDTKTLLSQLPFVNDVDETVEALKKEQKDKADQFTFGSLPFQEEKVNENENE